MKLKVKVGLFPCSTLEKGKGACRRVCKKFKGCNAGYLFGVRNIGLLLI